MKYVLFVCTRNAGRSQMAQAFFNRHAPDDVRAESAGSEPAESIWPEVVQVMAERGFDLTDVRPKKLTPEMQLHADWAVTLACGESCPYVPSKVEDWDIEDPHGKPLDEVRRIRDDVEGRVMNLLRDHIDDIRTDRTAHRVRLERLLPPLIEEFAEIRSPREIRACADAILGHYLAVPVRSFVMTIATKRARECLRRDVCDEVGVGVPVGSSP